MSHLKSLVEQLCPDGVSFKTLGEVGTFLRGSGIQKKDLAAEGIGAIHYGQIYTHYRTAARETKSRISTVGSERLRFAEPGNLVIAATSENIADVCKAVAWLGSDAIAVSSDAFIFRHELDPLYAAYFFQSTHFQDQKQKHITGTKVMRLSISSLERFLVPVPPLQVQAEISRILSEMEQLEAELEAELEARRKQYSYYRDRLLSFDESAERERERVRWLRLGSMARRNKGIPITATQMKIMHVANGPVRVFAAGRTIADVAQGAVPEVSVINEPSIIVKSRGYIGFEHYASPFTHKNEIWSYTVTDPAVLQKYVYYYLVTKRDELQRIAASTSVKLPQLSVGDTDNLLVPTPPFDEQVRIVEILDKFDAIVNDLSRGLPAEIAARRKQYEYYRDKLLTFEEVA